MPGTLYLVATPIGNLDDLAPRARRVLAAVAVVAAEDTRRTGQLLTHFGISRPLLSCYEHNERERSTELAARLAAGDDVALVSDAGSPGLSDPGYPVVKAALAVGAPVVAVPGPCAAILALQVSGLPTDRFTFVGFPPKKGAKRRAFLEEALESPGTVVAYVPARDTADVLEELAALATPPPAVAVARELTKLHEEVLRGPADEVARAIRAREGGEGVWKGEVTLVFAPERRPPEELTDDVLRALLADEQAKGATRNEALRRVREATGAKRARLYALL